MEERRTVRERQGIRETMQRFESLTADGAGETFFGHFMCFSISIYEKFRPPSSTVPCVVNKASVYFLDYRRAPFGVGVGEILVRNRKMAIIQY